MFYSGMIKLNSIGINNFSFGTRAKKAKTEAQNAVSAVANKNISLLPSVTMQQFMLKNRPLNSDKLSIYYYNDTHGNSDQMADVVNNANKFKTNAQNSNNATFILSAGDNCSGGDYKKNEFIFDLMQNIMGVELSAVGNHEVDAAGEGFYNALKDKNITFVATNVSFSDDNKMKELVKKSVIKEKGGQKYGFIGAMPIDFKMCTKEDVQQGVDVMDFENTVAALQKEIDSLKAQGVNRIIMLSHVGYDTDKRLAGELSGVDIIVGGHTHVVVEGAKEGENIVKSKSNEPVIITQGGENGKYYGILNVEFDNNGVIKKVENNLSETTNRSKNPVIEYVKSQNLGESPHIGVIKEAQPLPPNRRIEPCGWTEMMADSMKSELNGDIALINSANIRKVPMQGNLTERDVMESAPMKNRLVRAKLTQKQLIEAVKNASLNTMTASDGYPGLIQGSGFTYKIEDTGKLLEFNIIDKDGNKIPVDIDNPSEDITYTAIYDNFTAKADGETPELAPKFGMEEFDFDKDYTMCQYLSKLDNKEALVIKPDNRLEIIKTSGPKQKGNSSRKI